MVLRSANTRTAALLVAAGVGVVALVAVTAIAPDGARPPAGTPPTSGDEAGERAERAGRPQPERDRPAGSSSSTDREAEHAESRARALRSVEAWPSDEGLRFAERYSRDPASLAWMVAALGTDAYDLGELSTARRTTLVEALRRAPRERARAAILENAGEAAGQLASMLGLLEEVGSAEDVEPMIALVVAQDPPEPATLEALEGALARIFESDPRALHLLRDLFREQHRPVWQQLASSVGRSRQAAALDQLAGVLGRDPDLDGLVLTQMGRLGGLADPLEAWDVCYTVRGFLDDPRPGVRREAIVTLGKLRDGEATGRLLELLDDEQAGLRKSALWALKEITGIDLGEDPPRWRAWYREELDWWEQDYPGVVDVLRHGSPEEIGPAVATLTLKRLFRNRIADDLKQLLSHEAPELRVRACVALRELGSHVPVVDLTAALNDPDEKVRAAALDALRAITGLDLPADHDRWVEALGDDR